MKLEIFKNIYTSKTLEEYNNNVNKLLLDIIYFIAFGLYLAYNFHQRIELYNLLKIEVNRYQMNLDILFSGIFFVLSITYLKSFISLKLLGKNNLPNKPILYNKCILYYTKSIIIILLIGVSFFMYDLFSLLIFKFNIMYFPGIFGLILIVYGTYKLTKYKNEFESLV